MGKIMISTAGCNVFSYLQPAYFRIKLGKDNKMGRKKNKFKARSTGSAERRLLRNPVEFFDGQDNIRDILGKKFHKKSKKLLEIP